MKRALRSFRPHTWLVFHEILTVAWLIMVPVALLTGWISSLIFVSACSIYANFVGHFAAVQASKAEEQAN